MYRYFSLSLFALLVACSPYSPEKTMNAQEQEQLTITLAPFLYKKPDHVAFEDRTKAENERHYRDMQNACLGKFTHLKKVGDTLYFNFMYTDITSLYEHYKSFGGKTIVNGKQVEYINLYYHTPRIEPKDTSKINDLLFTVLVKKGNVDKYIGNRDLIHTPNEDFYYNVENRHWDYTPNSSWKFLEEIKDVEMPEVTDTTK